MHDYIIGNSSNISSKMIGLSWISRLSTLSISRAQPIDWHAHDSVEILICHKGGPRYEFADRPPTTLHVGHFLVIPPHHQHRIQDGIDGPSWRSSIFLKFPNTKTQIHNFFNTHEYRNLIAQLLEKRLSPRRVPFNQERNLSRLANLICNWNLTSELEKIELRSLTINTLISMSMATRPAVRDPTATLMDEATSWLESHLHEKTNLDKLVEHIGYGRSRFFALFRESTGLTPLEWLTRKRIERSKHLLAVEHLTVAETARAVGFTSPIFFSRTFRTHIGLSPRKWASSQDTISIPTLDENPSSEFLEGQQVIEYE